MESGDASSKIERHVCRQHAGDSAPATCALLYIVATSSCLSKPLPAFVFLYYCIYDMYLEEEVTITEMAPLAPVWETTGCWKSLRPDLVY